MDNRDVGKKQSTSITLPLRTTFAWRPSVHPPSDLNIWTWKLPDNLSFNQNLILSQTLTVTPPPNVLIVLIPGNPGLVDFYNGFLNRLFKNLSSNKISSQIVCAGHVGHSLNNSNADLSYLKNFLLFSDRMAHPKLKEQVEFHQDFLGHLASLIDTKHTKLILIGHSVGAYIATKVLEKYPDDIFHIFGLFPTLSNIGISRNGQSMALLFSPITLPFLHIFQLILSLLIPNAIIILLVKLFTSMTKSTPNQPALSYHNLTIACNLVKNLNSVSAALIMARSEMKEILDVDREFFRIHKDKVSLYYTRKNGDAWINEVEFEKISQLLESSSTVKNSKPVVKPITNDSGRGAIPREGIHSGKRYERSIEDVPHAFCLDHSEIMAQKCATWIQSILNS